METYPSTSGAEFVSSLAYTTASTSCSLFSFLAAPAEVTDSTDGDAPANDNDASNLSSPLFCPALIYQWVMGE